MGWDSPSDLQPLCCHRRGGGPGQTLPQQRGPRRGGGGVWGTALPMGPPYGAAATRQSLRSSFRLHSMAYSSNLLQATRVRWTPPTDDGGVVVLGTVSTP